MKLLWTSANARHGRKATARREHAEQQHAAAVRRAQVRSAHVAAAVASIPVPRAGIEEIPARRTPID